MAEALTTLTKLLMVREIEEDAGGATLRFQEGGQGRLNRRSADYATRLRLARRSEERQHPVGVSFGEGQAIVDVIRADNDVPGEFLEQGPDGVRVLFQGHDGVFLLKADHAEFDRIRTVLVEALRQKARVWFFTEKPDLALLDVLPAGCPAAASQATAERRESSNSR